MKSIQKTKAPGWFTALSIIALLWNLMGVMAYLAQVYMTDEILAALTQEQQDVINNAPLWANAAFALAVWGGLLGAITMMMKRKVSIFLFQLSFAGIFLQNIHSFFMIDSVKIYGLFQGLIMPSLAMFFGVVLILVNSTAKKSHWIR